MKLAILEVLKRKEKSKYWLWKRVDMSYINFSKMINNETKSIRYDILEKMCQELECSPNDVLKFDD